MKCVWGEETTGIYNNDSDNDAESCMGDAGMGDSLVEEPDDATVANAAMEAARRDVEKLTLEQLVQAPWPNLHGTGLFSSVARMNHSCAPNMKVAFPGNSACLTCTALLPVAAGDELCISYINQDVEVQTRRKQLLEYGFCCNCPRCVQEDSGVQRRAQRRLK